MEWIKSRMGTNLKQSTISATLAIVVSAFVLRIEPSNFAKDEIAVFTQSESELFDYVTKAEDFHEWFAIVGKVTEYNKGPLKVGKRYRVDFRSFIMPYYLNVEIRHLINGKSISFKAESIFEPIFNMNVTSAPSVQRSEGGFPKQRSKLSLQVYYERNSLLFQYTVAPVLNFFMQQHFQHSLFSLRWLLPSTS